MKILKKKTQYEGKNKETKTTFNFYLQLDNGLLVAIKPTFKNGYIPLCIISETMEGK